MCNFYYQHNDKNSRTKYFINFFKHFYFIAQNLFVANLKQIDIIHRKESRLIYRKLMKKRLISPSWGWEMGGEGDVVGDCWNG